MINWIKNTGVKPEAFKDYCTQVQFYKTETPSFIIFPADMWGWFLNPDSNVSIQYYRLLFKTREEAREAKRLSSMDLSVVKLEEKILSYPYLSPVVELGWALELKPVKVEEI